MDSNQDKEKDSGASGSWSIPKKSRPPQQQSDSVIPCKVNSNSGGGGGNNASGGSSSFISIPRKPQHLHSARPLPSATAAFPRSLSSSVPGQGPTRLLPPPVNIASPRKDNYDTRTITTSRSDQSSSMTTTAVQESISLPLHPKQKELNQSEQYRNNRIQSCQYPLRPDLSNEVQQRLAQLEKPSSTTHDNIDDISQVVSERPFTIRIDLTGIDIRSKGIPGSRVSARAPKDERTDYNELDDTDSDDDRFLIDSSDEDDDDYGRNSKKKKSSLTKKMKLQKGQKSPLGSTSTSTGRSNKNQFVEAVSADPDADYQAPILVGPSLQNIDAVPSTSFLQLGNHSVESPPPGTLSTLWYSREVFVNVFIVEKILAWKTRPVTQLEWDPDSYTEFNKPTMPPVIDPSQAAKYASMALCNPVIWRDSQKRMEVSRLSPQCCHVVMSMAVQAQLESYDGIDPTEQKNASSDFPSTMDSAAKALSNDQHSEIQASSKESEKATFFGSENTGNFIPRFRIKPFTSGDSQTEREEVYLVKWRGKSHLHVSWERDSDIIRMDQSNNTARSKIRRFVQSQEVAYGKNWKAILEEERSSATNLHSHGEHGLALDDQLLGVLDEEFYPPAVTEVERIIACDESEMDLSLYAKQRALNILDEQDRVQRKEDGTAVKWNSKEGLRDLLRESPWDPEENVRFVVKWKGLPFADMTWEYWRDIKTDAVDEAEDFWIRQRPPDDSTIAESMRPHPHMQYFRKIQASPVFGISSRKRPVADTINGRVVLKEDDEEASNTGFRLRNYQLEGVNWLLFNWWNRRSCILADEMGLGKTIQSVGFLKILQDFPTRVRGPFLIVAPLSLIGQWQSETKTWAPDLNVVLYHGSADARDFLIKQDFFYIDQFVPKKSAKKFRKQYVTKFHILITTYEVILKDIDVFTNIKWKTLIVDEAHRLKNPRSKLFEELSSVPRDYCILLTGTPLSNATEELWALLNFADPASFGSKDEFLDKFGQLTDAGQVSELHAILKPYLLRRVKEDVEKSLPPKQETILEVSLTPIQKNFYKAIYERNTAFLYKGAKPSNSPSLMNVMMELRKVCNHPFLVRGAEDRILAEAAEQMKAGGQEIDNLKLFGEQLVKSSGKMVLINKLLPKLFSNGHKVLIFSQMVRVLDLLEELLKICRYKYERLDGTTSSSMRGAAVDRFTRRSCQRFVMLLSTRAGGLGLNLTAADIVIIFDSDWNPQNDLQAMARAHRIGQTKAVRVYRLLTAKTYEMHMFHSASMKLGLERAVLSQQKEQSEDGVEGSKSKSKSEKEAQAREIDELLKKGAYDIFRDDNDEEAKKFMETDIDQLMENSSKPVTYGKQQSNLSSGLGSFSKASFVTDTGDGEKDVDLDDPEFWSKAVGLEKPIEIPEEIGQMIDDGVKRSRKQVQQYNPYAEYEEEERRKEERITMQIQVEKEEKQRMKEEKKKKKIHGNERKRREREEMEGQGPYRQQKKTKTKTASHLVNSGNFRFKKRKMEDCHLSSTPAQTKTETMAQVIGRKKVRAVRKADNENFVFERLKQAWDSQHRNRMIAACLRFGFFRFNKIRNDSGLHSLPIQDVEVFYRSFFYQQSVQLAVSFMQKIQDEGNTLSNENIHSFLLECLGYSNNKELEWLSDCLLKGLRHCLDVECYHRTLRIPSILMEPTYVADLRKGAALRSLRRIYSLSRLGRVFEDCLDEMFGNLGNEQLGQRGCQTNFSSSMDLDLKARLFSTEELTLSIQPFLKRIVFKSPAAWWDRSCDVALLVGTFLYGLGNYDPMLDDEMLPFASKICEYARTNNFCADAHRLFKSVTDATKQVCDDALEASKLKAQKEVQKAVAAAAAASKKLEKEAAALRKGGSAAEEVTGTTNVPTIDDLYDIKEGQDAHFITLPRLKGVIEKTIRESSVEAKEVKDKSGVMGSSAEVDSPDESKGRRKSSSRHALSMPDARILDFRLFLLLDEIDKCYAEEVATAFEESILRPPLLWPCSDRVRKIYQVKNSFMCKALRSFSSHVDHQTAEYAGIGFSGRQCGVRHKILGERTDFSISAASSGLYHIAHGPESPRYLRALGVPMTFGRFGLAALVYADPNCLQRMLSNERLRFSDSGEQQKPDYPKQAILKRNENTSATVAGGDFPNKFINNSADYQTINQKEHQISLRDSKELLVSENDGVLAGPNKTSADNKEKDEALRATNKSSLSAVSYLEKVETLVAKVDNSQSKDEGSALESAVGNVDKNVKVNNERLVVSTQGVDNAILHSDFEANDSLRTGICLVLLYYGCPSGEVSDLSGCKKLLHKLDLSGESSLPLFHSSRFQDLLHEVCGKDIVVPNTSVIGDYIQTCFLPHCLKLCLYGNGHEFRDTRGSKGEYKTADGISRYAEPTQGMQSPLPDPCLALKDQSIEAVGVASAILRRVRLMQCIISIVQGTVSADDLVDILKTPSFCQNMDGLPKWWCPWIHDIALLLHAASRGLFSIIKDRSESDELVGRTFSRESVIQHIRSSCIGEKQAVSSKILGSGSSGDNETWIESQAQEFPSLNVIERRLAFLCAMSTEKLDEDMRYDNLPMFDHGAWPRN